ncbi:MAG: glycine cleavage system aminomethyltransferase GcvT [bacterium]
MENLKRTPLFQKHVDLGAKMVPFGGWEMPVSYPQGIIAEHNAVRNSLGLFDIGHMGLIKIEGDGALPFIQKVATNDASKLEINSCQYSVLCNDNGGVVDDILVYRLPMLYMIIANASNTDKVLAWLKKNSSGLNIGLYENYCALSLQGPEAVKVVEKTFHLSLSSLARNHTLWWRDIILSRTGYTGEDGVEMFAAKKEVANIWQSFIDQGVQPCGLGARDTLRLEAGLPLYGHEYNEETTPLEAGYSWAVKLNKGDFIGREALVKEKEAGLKKILVGISLEGRAIPREGSLVFGAGSSEPLGKVTSGTFSPTLKKPIALAYLNSEAKEGSILIRGEKRPARVVDKAFYKRVK